MTFGDLKIVLREDIARHPELFEAARARQLALAAHVTAAAVLGILHDELTKAHAEKDTLTLALLDEYRAGLRGERLGPAASFSTTLLLAAFYPMLQRLRVAIIAEAADREDMDHLIVEAFLETAESLPLDGRARLPLRLRSRTRRAVFRRLRREQLGQRKLNSLAVEVAADEHRDPFDRRDYSPKEANDPEEHGSLAQLLVERVGSSVEQSKLDLVIATLIRGESLTCIIQQQHPDMPAADRERLYQRIKRQHSRTLARLKKLLHGMQIVCPRPQAGGLFLLE